MVNEPGLMVFGNTNIDRIYSVKELPGEGQSTPVTGHREVFGGCGGNISVAAARMGVEVRLSTVIGKDFPEAYTALLEDAGVDLGDIKISDDMPSPYCIILSAPGGRQCYAFNFGSMAEQAGMDPPTEGLMSNAHIATSHPEYSIRTASHLRQNGVSVAIDPGMEIFFRWNREQLSRVLGVSHRFFGNLGEWKHLAEKMGWKERSVEVSGATVPVFDEAFKMIDEAAITLGSDGSALIDGNGVHSERVRTAGKVTDATGAGDAFRGGFYGALLRGKSSRKALSYGNALGAISVKGNSPHDYRADWNTVRSMVEK